MKTRIIILTGIIIVSAGIMSILYAISAGTLLRDDFTRRFSHTVSVEAVTDINTTKSYFAGMTNHVLYLGTESPLSLNIYDSDSLNYVNIEQLRLVDGKQLRRSRIYVDGEKIILIDAASNSIYKGQRGVALKLYSTKKYFMAETVPLSITSYIIRTTKANSPEFTLAKISGNNAVLSRNPELLQKQIDGRFCTDGKLLHSSTANSLFYVYFYRNEFMKFDTALHLQYRSHTIDSFARAQLKPVNNISQSATVLSEPSALINSLSYADDSHLYINSNVIGNNEDKSEFTNSSVIDVYEVESGKYSYSFHIPRYHGYAIKDFMLSGRNLYAIHNKYLVLYHLAANTLDHGSQ